MLVAFAIGVRTGRHRGVDTAWGLGFTAVAVTGLLLSAGHGDGWRRALATALVAVWGLRLSAHLWWHARGKDEDPRYAAMLARAPEGPARTRLALTKVYLLQAVLLWFVSLPVQVAQRLPDPPSAVTYLGLAVWALGLTFEAVGDHQLARFRADPANRGRVLGTGLWAWTRHPNYFGDACVWWGLFLLAADHPAGWATLLSPILMTWLLAFGSGRPMAERGTTARSPEWAAYAARTSAFLPRPPRRS
ncbi:DUF1295 domain-containing protein [Kitasatospora sp. NPDC096147]|uniref:DUF1295 domain-containing protein n=1 Tax=Kitasatospora sp. NPDC096147 TaxID=3364093 RepID=UPI0038018E6B